ncbi:large ribosomal subunit protein uL2m-like [Amphiura filiformis]|uniref:large ribosomal subunit protein uL2m-like n=1 Tax=Amphiura filiformis TaxID=82378 RepID=UPI003B2197B3
MSLRTLCNNLRQLAVTNRQLCITHPGHGTNGFMSKLLLPATTTHCCGSNLGAGKQHDDGSEVRQFHTTAAMERSKFIPFGRTGKQKYTVRPLPMVRYAGRDLDTGRIIHKRLGGGHKQRYRMLDYFREPPADDKVYEERVLDIQYDPNRSARIALVAGGNHKRYIIATVNMKAGDIIKTSGQVSRLSVTANEGDAYRLAALPIGQLVHGIPKYPGDHGRFCRAAGTSGQIVRKIGGMVVIQLPSKRQISVSDQCMVTIGRVSNEDHNKRVIGKAGRNRWLGIRPKSGLWHRKDGRHGRKIKPLPPIQVFMDKKQEGVHINV